MLFLRPRFGKMEIVAVRSCVPDAVHGDAKRWGAIKIAALLA
jgi:hypothetical protein